MSTNEQQFHYFASCAFCWRVSDTLEGLAKKLRRDSGAKRGVKIHYAIFKVPLPKKAHYEIEFFAPKVKGTELVEKGEI